MKRLALLVVITIVVLAIAVTSAWFSLHQNGWLERYVSASLTRDNQEFYSFNGISLKSDFSFTVLEPTYKRGSMEVAASSINILPWYGSLITANPVPARYSVKDATVLWPALKITGLNIEGYCPDGGLEFSTNGSLKASVRGDNLVEDGFIEAPYSFSEKVLKIPSLLFKCKDKQMEANVEAILRRNQQKVEVNLNFGSNAPWFKIYDDVTTTFNGQLCIKADLPPDKPIGEADGIIDLSRWGATIQRKELKSSFLFTKGAIEASKGNITLNDLILNLPGNGTTHISGSVKNVIDKPEYAISANCSGLKISELIQYLPEEVRKKVESKTIFGTIESTLEVTGSPDPKPTLKIALKGIGLEEVIGETKQRFLFNSGSLTLKPQPAIILSGADLSLSGIKAEAAGNIAKTKEGWTGRGRIEAKDVSLPVLGAFLPSHLSSQLAALNPKGTVSTNVSVSLSEGLKPEIKGQIDLSNLKLTLPEEAGSAVIKSEKLTLTLDGSKAILEPAIIWLATIPVRPHLEADFSVPENPTFNFSIDALKIKSSNILPFLPQAKRTTVKELIATGQAGINVTVYASGKGNIASNEWSAKIKQDKVFLKASAKRPPLRLENFEVSVTNDGLKFVPCKVTFMGQTLVSMKIISENILLIKSDAIPAKTLFALMPPSIHQFAAPLSPQGNLSIYGKIPFGETKTPLSMAVRMKELSVLLPDESGKKRIVTNGRIIWSGEDNSIHLDEGRVQAGKVVLNFSDGVIVSNVTNDPYINLTLEGKSVAASDLAAILPPVVTDYIGPKNINGNLSFVSSIKGKPDQIAGIARLDMTGLSLNLDTSVISLHPKVTSGEMTLKLFTRGDKVTAHGTLSKPLNITILDSTVSIAGTVKDMTKSPHFQLSLNSTPLSITKLLKNLKGQAEAARSYSPAGSLLLGGTMEGTTDEINGGITLTTKGIKATVATTVGEIPIAIDQGSAEVSISYSKGTAPKVKLEIAKGMVVKVFNHPISIKAAINSLLGEKQVSLSATSIKIPVAKILKDVLKDTDSKLLPGFKGTIKKVSVNVKGEIDALAPGGWADVSGLSFKHPNLTSPFKLQSGRIALGKDYSFLWKNLTLALGQIQLHSDGNYGPSFETGSFTKSRIHSSFPLKEVPSLLKLNESLSMRGHTFLSGNITGKIPLPALEGSIAVPGRFQINIKGSAKPFMVQGHGLKTNWNFNTGVGKLELNDFVATMAGGLIKSWANVSILAEDPEHEIDLALSSINLDSFLKTGAAMGGLLQGLLNSELSLKLAGELKTLTGDGTISIGNMKLNGTRLFKIAGLNQYLPDKKNTSNSLGGFLFNLAAKKIAKNSKKVRRALVIRDVLHNVFNFGVLNATIKAENGKLQVLDLKNEGGQSQIRGYMIIDLETLAMDSVFSLKLVKDYDEVNIYDFKVVGTVSEPDFKLPRGLASFKHIDNTPPPPPPPPPPPAPVETPPAPTPSVQSPGSP